MLIAVDIGNSRIKGGLFQNNKLTKIISSSDTTDILNFIKTFRDADIVVSSVVPGRTKSFAEEVKNLNGKNITIINKDLKLNLQIAYKTPESLGTDRLCAAEGALHLFKNSENFKEYKNGSYILVIDFGTATTINVIEYPEKFIGGLIAPGFEMMFDSLKQKTAQLPHLSVSEFVSAIGVDTKSSIASGVVTSVTGMIEKTINYLKENNAGISRDLSLQESLKKVFVYLTGGNAKKIIPHLSFDFIYEEGLVLYGINALWNLNRSL